MFEQPNIVVGLEIGTCKICAVVAEVDRNGIPGIIGLGQCKSRGVRKGEITNVEFAEEDIRHALREAEDMSNSLIHSVYVGVSGGHIGGFNNHGVHHVPSIDREITENDVESAVQNAKVANLGADRYAIHFNRHCFTVNGQNDVTDPVGMAGSTLEVDVHITYGNFNRLQNPVKVIKNLQLDVDGIVFNGLASALAVMSPDQKKHGTLVIDFGAGTTDFVLYQDGFVRHSGVLAVGGDHISQDLAFFFKSPMAVADKLKMEHGGAFVDESIKGRVVTLPSEHGLPGKTINLEHLRHVMVARVQETLELIEEELQSKGMMRYLRSGVVVTGGGANIPGIHQLAENIFQVPGSIGCANSMSGAKDALDKPEFATAIGLVRFAAGSHRKRKDRSLKRWMSPKNIVDNVKGTIGDLFNI